jgi:hypothetical protein
LLEVGILIGFEEEDLDSAVGVVVCIPVSGLLAAQLIADSIEDVYVKILLDRCQLKGFASARKR